MSNLNTLKPFQKGHDPRRNTKGRPKGPSPASSWQKLITEHLMEIVPGTDMTYQELMVRRLIKDGLKGKLSAIKLLFEYKEGKPRQVPIDHYDREKKELPKPILGGRAR